MHFDSLDNKNCLSFVMNVDHTSNGKLSCHFLAQKCLKPCKLSMDALGIPGSPTLRLESLGDYGKVLSGSKIPFGQMSGGYKVWLSECKVGVAKKFLSILRLTCTQKSYFYAWNNHFKTCFTLVQTSELDKLKVHDAVFHRQNMKRQFWRFPHSNKN